MHVKLITSCIICVQEGIDVDLVEGYLLVVFLCGSLVDYWCRNYLFILFSW